MAMRRFVLLLLSCLTLALGQQMACAQNDQGHIISQAFYSDKTNTLTYDEVQSVLFTPYQGLLTGGFSQGAYWIKLKISASDKEHVLKIRPPFTEEIELFDHASTQNKAKVGARYPASASDIDALSYNYVLPPSVVDRDVYLRLKSARSYLAYVEVMPVDQYRKVDRREQLIYSGYVTFTLILALWLFVTWMVQKELVLGVFTLQQFLAFFHACFYTGVGKALLEDRIDPRLLNSLFGLMVVTYPFVAYLANKLLLEIYGLKKVFKWFFNGLLVMALVVIGGYLAGSSWALKLNNIVLLWGMLFFWVTVWFGLDPSQATHKASALPVVVLRAFYTLNAIIWVITILPNLGLVDVGEMAMYSVLVYNVVSGSIFFFILQHRAKALLQSEMVRASALQTEAEQERQRREEQSMLMAMLSHEIKTPLSVLKLVMDEKVAGSDLEGHANRAVGNINFIVNRCLQLGKLDAKAIQPNPALFDGREFIGALLQDCQAMGRVQANVPGGLVVYTDKEILRVVVSNLLENALKYSAADSLIEIEMARSRKGEVNGVRITVRNVIGPLGVPDAEQVFKKYYRNTQATKITGSGLGLFLVHELVGVMGGEVLYTSEQNHVVFSVWIPV